MPPVLAAPEDDVHLYVCGPGGFMQHVLDSARAQGWQEEPASRVFRRSAGRQSSRWRIFSTGGQQRPGLRHPGRQDRGAGPESHGIEIAMSCEQGICGTCLTRVLDGIPDHRDLFLTEEEQALNDQFTPCCSRSKTPLLVLDI
jgi:vanillate O-demethylase ferredoxin subunit